MHAMVCCPRSLREQFLSCASRQNFTDLYLRVLFADGFVADKEHLHMRHAALTRHCGVEIAMCGSQVATDIASSYVQLSRTSSLCCALAAVVP
jgi:hypothetical protein